MATTTTAATALELGTTEFAYSLCSGEYEDEEIPGVRVAREGHTLLIDVEGERVGSGEASLDDLFCLLFWLDVPETVVSRMENTSAMAGQLEAHWTSSGASLRAYWTYHPYNGLDVIVEQQD